MPTVAPSSLYTAANVRELDRLAIEERAIPSIQLMKRAARAVFSALLERWSQPEKISVFCGSGNNAGDGYVIAALAAQRGIPVKVIQVGDVAKLSPTARQAYDFALQEQVAMYPFSDCSVPQVGVVVDALLGTGTQGEMREPYAQAIRSINNSALPVVAVDIPSGLCADTGSELGVAIKAELTVSFIGLKRGLLTGRGPALSGELVFDGLSVPEELYPEVVAETQRLQLAQLLANIPQREVDAHKGDFGHVMIIGGDSGYGGAALMAAEAASRAGAGLVSVATRPEHVAAVLARCPELMVSAVRSGQELEPLLCREKGSRPDVLVIGPGLGRSAWSEQMLQQAANSGLPLVMDADALNILAEGRVIPAAKSVRDNWLLTPHPGEAGRLLGLSTAEVQADRFAAVKAMQQRYGGAVVLKGAGSLIADDGDVVGLCTEGNPGMASGGMGDVLSGILGALLVQGLSVSQAANLGVCLHSSAADMAAEDSGQIGLRATDLIPYVRELMNSGCDER